MSLSVLDLFAGPGGWDLAATRLGLNPLGIEWDAAACETRKAAGLRTLHGDVSTIDPNQEAFWGTDLLIASPPCQAWSMAGKRLGEQDKEHVIACSHELAAGNDTRAEHRANCEDERSLLVVEALRWALALRPTFIAFEQVPPVLELWTLYASLLERIGYRCWTGILEAERYGVPQTRERAILIASLNGPVAPPHPTHQRYIPGEPARHDFTLEGEVLPWVSMAEALGWQGELRRSVGERQRENPKHDLMPAAIPCPTLDSKARSWERVNVPAPTVTAGGSNEEKGHGIEVFARGGAREDCPLPSYRRTRGEGMTERNGERRDHPPDEPAPTMTAKARSDEWVYDTRYGGFGKTHDDDSNLRGGHQPAPAITSQGLAKGRDVIRPKKAMRSDAQAKAAVRSEDEPAPTIKSGHCNAERVWVEERPAPTIVTTRRSDQGIVVGRQLPEGEGRNVGGRIAQPGHTGNGTKTSQMAGAVRVTEQEAAILQSFPPDYPFQGSRSKRFEQIGNAVPPLLAEAILRALLGEELAR